MTVLIPKHNLILASPAKLNLSLHIIERLKNGYHQLQSIMQLIDLQDSMSFNLTNDDTISLECNLPEINNTDNLVIKAANILKTYTLPGYGISIVLKKNIPLQAGLGGGSSNAASCLLALNYLWKLNLSTTELATIGMNLGADVPFFIYGKNSIIGGIGEKIELDLRLPKTWFVVIKPPCDISTSALFNSSLLNFSKKLTSQQMLDSDPYNDCLEAATHAYPPLATAIDDLSRYSRAYMTGTGSCIFAKFNSRAKAVLVAKKLNHYRNFVVRGIEQSPAHVQLGAL